MAKLLIVDDSADLRTMMAAMFRACKHDVLLACDGAEALAMVESFAPDLILLDIHMPVLGGIEVLERLWVRSLEQKARPIPVIVLTADSDPRMSELAMSLGAKATFVKSRFQMTTLMTALEQAQRAA